MRYCCGYGTVNKIIGAYYRKYYKNRTIIL